MKQLSPEACNQARHFLKTQARALDRALYEHRFEEAPVRTVMAALSTYQNEDGGFGRALEADLRTPTSSALATGHGLSLLKELNCQPSHPAVSRAIQYLLDSFEQEAQVWRVVPWDTNDYPHAPWWHDDGTSLAQTFDNYVIIPRAQILGLLWHFSGAAPKALSIGWLEEVTERTVSEIESLPGLGSGRGDDLAYTLDLLETEALPDQFQDRLASRIREVVPAAVSRKPEEWGSYCIVPLKLAPSPRSFAASLIWDGVQAHLDYQIGHQTPEGSWDPTWTWSEWYPEAWSQAKLEWRGHLTLETLTSLQAYGRIQK